MKFTSLLIVSLFSLILTSLAFPIIPREASLAIRRRAAYSVVAVDGGTTAMSTPNAAPMPPATTIIKASAAIVTVTAPAITLPPSIETIVTTKVVTNSEPAKTFEVFVTSDITKTTSLPSKLKYVVVNDDTPSSSPAIISMTTTSTTLTAIDCTTTTSSTPRISAISISASTVASTLTTSAIATNTATIFSTSTSSRVATTTPTLPQASIPPIETVIPEEKGWSAPAELVPPPSVTSTALSTQPTSTSVPISKPYEDGMWHSNQPTATSKTYDNGMWHTTYPSWNATLTVLSSSSTTASITIGAYNAGSKG